MDKNNIVITKADCGIHIVGEKIPGVHSVSLGVWVKAGPVYENANERGISHFIEHMLFKGTKKRSAKQLATEIDSVGGSMNAFTAKENTCFYVRVLDEDINLAVDVLLDMLCNPKLDDADIENEKGVVCEEILMGEDDPCDVAHEKLCSLIFKGEPLEHPILGSTKSVRAITRNDIISYMDRRYVPENIVIACAGSFDADELVSLVNEKYNPREKNETGGECKKSSYSHEKRFEFIKKDVEQAHICLSFPSPEIYGKDALVMAVIDNAFGGATSSRLFQHIREQKGLAYSVYSVKSSYTGTGYWTLYAGTAQSNASEVVKCMLEEIKQLRQTGLSEQEFLRSKQQLRRSFMLSLETVAVHSSSIGKDLLYLGKVRTDTDILNELDSVTQSDVNRVIHEYITSDRLCCVLVCKGSEKNEAAQIKEIIMNESF